MSNIDELLKTDAHIVDHYARVLNGSWASTMAQDIILLKNVVLRQEQEIARLADNIVEQAAEKAYLNQTIKELDEQILDMKDKLQSEIKYARELLDDIEELERK